MTRQYERSQAWTQAGKVRGRRGLATPDKETDGGLANSLSLPLFFQLDLTESIWLRYKHVFSVAW